MFTGAKVEARVMSAIVDFVVVLICFPSKAKEHEGGGSGTTLKAPDGANAGSSRS